MFHLGFLFSEILVLKMIYNNGNTNSVRNVAVIKPPITTVANGFCTSAPALLLNAIGKKNPKLATVAVINTGRNLIFVPSITLSKNISPSFFF